MLRPEIISLLIPIMTLMIPIVAILTAHQRKMAEMFHGAQQNLYNPEVAALRQEVQELKQLMHQQAIALDNLATRQAPSTLQDRISNGVS